MDTHPTGRAARFGFGWSRRVTVAVLLMLTLILAACGGADPTPTPPPPTPTAVPLLEEPEAEATTEPEQEAADEAEGDTEAEAEDAEAEDAEAEDTEAEDAEATATPAPEEEPADAEMDDAAGDEEVDEEGDEEGDEVGEGAVEEADADDDAPEDAFLVSITMPDGTVCLHAGRGATLALDEMRINYTCEGEAVGGMVLGEMSTRLDLLTVEYGLTVDGDDGMDLESPDALELRMTEVTLADGTVCLNAGQGATQAFDGARVNFTCEAAEDSEMDSETDGELVLIGDMTIDLDVLSATLVRVVEGEDGPEVAESSTAYVIAVVGARVEE